MTTPAEIDLEQRLTALFGMHDVHPQDRMELRAAFDKYLTWDALPQEIKDRIVELETDLPQESWGDPMDMPDGQV